MNLRKEAVRRDKADPLARYRERFHLPDGIIYLDGNSLGALPKATCERMAQVVTGEWGQGLIRSWNDAGSGGAGWISLSRRVGAKIAPLIGADTEEVIACDSTSVNLFKLIAAALDMQARQAGGAGLNARKVILSEAGNFPTDLYMIAGLERQGLAERRLAERDGIAAALSGDVALLMLTHVHYKTGAMYDMRALTAAAQDAGALVLWDLSHSTGAVPVVLNDCNADFAVGCGYKYLNGGPGAPAFAYAARRHHDRLAQPLTGWFGHERPFAFVDDYAPAPGIERMLAGTPPVLGLSALEVGVDLIAEIGIANLREKSLKMGAFFLECLEQMNLTLELVSPANGAERGSQLSFRHDEAYAISQALIARGVIGDFRDPDILRLGFAPAYLSFGDLWQAADILRQVITNREWDRDQFRRRAAVT
ncbi:kynureninase [Pseudopontixanthobacter vadosimaris]|uniref:kynureninase n=1 Tax=Pseudopontixanthobacter vadosimaris TaxID=2726450 RepID=UPI001474D991|nr:kynureninase [Pseudopontixanthobacter vadosimaris]